MDGLEEKLGAVLNNPQMMQQIMTMAQTLNSQTAKEDAPAEEQNTALLTLALYFFM